MRMKTLGWNVDFFDFILWDFMLGFHMNRLLCAKYGTSIFADFNYIYASLMVDHFSSEILDLC